MLTFASDFGSPYPAAVKGVLCSRVDESVRIVDVAHDLPRQSVRAAAFWLRETLPYFPPAVHLVVVDPGVGTDRAAVALRVGDHALVGPDNGVLRPVARRLAEAQAADDGADTTPEVEAFEIHYENPASATFHGRDVFGPAAGEIHAAGVDAVETLSSVDPMPVADLVNFELPAPAVDGSERRATGEVLVVDDFGNVITNVPGTVLDGVESVLVNGDRVPAVESFAGVDRGERLVTVGSHGNVECDVNHGRGDEAFDLRAGDRVVVEW